jgi:hypothetical protein
MNNKIKIIASVLTLLAINSHIISQTISFTTLCSSNESVYAGVKVDNDSSELESYILQISLSTYTTKKIELPSEISNREIVGLFYSQTKSLIVMSQWTIEDGDFPQFHTYHISRNNWSKSGELPYVSFTKIHIKKNALIFTCYPETWSYNQIKKKISFNNEFFLQKGRYKSPIIKTVQKENHAELIGELNEWNKLRIYSDDYDTLISLEIEHPF